MNFLEWLDKMYNKQSRKISGESVSDSFKRAEESRIEFRKFMMEECLKNQTIMTELTNSFRNRIESEDRALEIIDSLVQDKNVPKEYRRYSKKKCYEKCYEKNSMNVDMKEVKNDNINH